MGPVVVVVWATPRLPKQVVQRAVPGTTPPRRQRPLLPAREIKAASDIGRGVTIEEEAAAAREPPVLPARRPAMAVLEQPIQFQVYLSPTPAVAVAVPILTIRVHGLPAVAVLAVEEMAVGIQTHKAEPEPLQAGTGPMGLVVVVVEVRAGRPGRAAPEF